MAHVKSEETDKWWRFDDETSSLMERGPVGESSDHGVASTVDKNGAPAKVRLCQVHVKACTVDSSRPVVECLSRPGLVSNRVYEP